MRYFDRLLPNRNYVNEHLTQPELHPFIKAMGDFLLESGRRAQRPGLVNTLMRGSANKYQEDIQTLMSLVDKSKYQVFAHFL